MFHVSDPVVHLSLNQGTTAVREEFGARAREILQDRADLMRKRVAEFAEVLPIAKIDLGSSARLPGDYAAGHALGVTYELINLPDEAKYVYHRKIERNRTAARQAKKFHGTRCQVCKLDFAERYGDIGKGFIEAHHLRPIATLEEGVPVKYDVAADFAVLCSNCHRMIHRFVDPSDLAKFQTFINAN